MFQPKKSFSRFVSAAVCLALIVSAFAACTDSGSPSASTTTPAAQTTAPAGTTAATNEPSAPATITYPITAEGSKSLSMWMPIQPPTARHMSSHSEQEVYMEINKNTGIDMTYYHPAVGQEKEQLGVLLAAGDLPDIIQIRGLWEGGSNAGVEDGVFIDLTDLVKEHGPDYWREITRSDKAYRIATNNDGRITELMIIKQSGPPHERFNYRQDVMDELGLDIPVTVADYEEDFAKMKEAGLYAFAPTQYGRMNQFMWIYGITPGFFLGEDGNVKHGESEPAYKEYLTMMNEWYNKGYLYPDFMTQMNDIERRGLFTSKAVGMIWQPVDLVKSASDAVDVKSVPLNFPRIAEGQQIHFMPASMDTLPIINESTTVISSSCKNPIVAMQYLNYFFTQEGADLCNWGIKDKAYTVDANGKKTFTDYMLKNETIPLGDVQVVLKIHQIAKLAEPDVVCNPNVVSNAESLEYRMRYSDDTTVDDAQVLPAFRLGLEDNKDRSEIMRDINTYCDEMTVKFITGVTPLNEFDAYLAQLKAMRIDEAIRITQEGYQKFLAKDGIPS